MKTFFKLIVLALAAYGAWFLWENYDLKGWYENAKIKIDQGRIIETLALPKKKSEPYDETKIIRINEDCTFSPAEIEIKKGERLAWYNASHSEQMLFAEHFDIKVIKSGKYFTKIFNETGDFSFSCNEDGSAENQGKIIVR